MPMFLGVGTVKRMLVVHYMPMCLGVGTMNSMLLVCHMPMCLGVGTLNRMLVVRHMPMCLGVGTHRMLIVYADVPWCWHCEEDAGCIGAASPPTGRGPVQMLSSMKSRSGELPRRQPSVPQPGVASPQGSGGSFPHAHQTPFSHSSSWGPRANAPQGSSASGGQFASRSTPQGAMQGSLSSASSGQLGSRAAPPATPPQQSVEEPQFRGQVRVLMSHGQC